MPELAEKCESQSVIDPDEAEMLGAFEHAKPAEIERYEYNSFDSADSDDFSDYSDFEDNVEHTQDLATNVVKKPVLQIVHKSRRTQTEAEAPVPAEPEILEEAAKITEP